MAVPNNPAYGPIYIVLMHTSVTNRKGMEVTTAVTNMDIHDISRSARTYGVRGYFLVTPIEDQHELMGRIVGHWRTQKSKDYHPDRFEAVSLVRMARSFDEVKKAIMETHGCAPEVVLTDARPLPQSVTYAQYRAELEDRGRSLAETKAPKTSQEVPPAASREAAQETKPVLLVFGTGWGISESFYPEVHRILTPVYGPEGREGYNHLSVRSAVAIILDRLFGQ